MSENMQEYKRALGHALKTRRESCGLTKQRLALMAGTNRLTLRKIESGEGNPTLDVLLSLCESLEITLADLLPDEQEKAGDSVTYETARLD